MKLSGIARGALVCLTALALGAGVSGCGSNGGGAQGSPAAPTSATTAPTPSPSPSPTSPSTAASAAQPMTKADFVSSVLGSMQSGKSMHMSMRLGDSFSEQADMSYASSGLEMKASLQVSGQREKIRYVGGAMYLAMPGTTPPGKFIKIGSDNPMLGQLIGRLEALRPQDFVKTLRQGIRSVRDLGTTRIAGETVRHFRVTVSATPRQRALAKSLAGSVQVPKSIDEDIYLSRDNLIRRTVVDVSGQQMTVDYTRWGEPVHVKAPSAARVIQMPTGGAPSSH